MKKVFIAIIVLVVIALGIYFIMGKSQPLAPVQTNVPTPNQPSQASSESPQVPPAPASLSPQVAASIIYTDSGYTPQVLKIKAGTIVTYKNQSNGPMWPASAKHPTHTLYPTTGGCIGSTFDACQGIPPGGTWSFKFDIVGDWKYHDHLNPARFGSVTVEK